MRKLIQFTTCLVLLSALHVRAQDPPPPEEITLEEELNTALDGEADTGTTEPLPDDTATLEDEMSLSEEDPASGLITPVPVEEAELTQPPTPDGEESESERVREIEPRYVINGWAAGVEVWQHRYDIKAGMTVTTGASGQNVDLSSSSADFQSIGFKGRYAIVPYNAIGTDLNLTAGTSLNHGSNSFASIHTLRAEVNLTYAFEMGMSGAFYILGGAGYEYLFGEDIEGIVAYGGAGTAQAGVGLTFESFSAEVFYMQAYHRINDGFIQKAGNQALAQGATSYTYKSEDASVTAQMISGRVMFKF